MRCLLVKFAGASTGLTSATAKAIAPVDVTVRLIDGLLDESVRIAPGKRSFAVLDLQTDHDAAALRRLTLSLFVPLLDGMEQRVRIYAYASDGYTVNTAAMIEAVVTAGWNHVDATPLLAAMTGFGFLKFRVTAPDSWVDLSEAWLIPESAVGLDLWDIAVEPESVDFGTVGAGEYVWATVGVKNAGMGRLAISDVNGEGPFSILQHDCMRGDFWSDNTCTITIGFQPVQGGLHEGKIRIESNDMDNPVYELSVRGLSVPADNSISGAIRDSATGLPLSDVAVTLNVARKLSLSIADIQCNGIRSAGNHDLLSENDDKRLIDGGFEDPDNAVQTFGLRNPCNHTDSIGITWNGMAGDSRDILLSQSFKAGKTGMLTSVRLMIYAHQAESGSIRVFLKSGLSGDAEDLLSSSNSLSFRDAPRSYEWVEFTFPTPARVESGKTYHLRLVGSGQINGYPCGVLWAGNSTVSYPENGGYKRERLAWKSVDRSFSYETYVDGKRDQQNVPQDPLTISGTAWGYPHLNTVSMSVFNQAHGYWRALSATGMGQGFDDGSAHATIDLNPSEYYDADGWVTVKVTNRSGYDQNWASYIATDMIRSEFIETCSLLSDETGVYCFEDMPRGTYSITYNLAGYIPRTQTGQVSSLDRILLDVVLEPAPPIQVSVTSPLEGDTIVTTNDQIIIRGTVSEKCTVMVNGKNASVIGETFTGYMQMTPGENVFTVMAIGPYGQTATDSVTVIFAPPLPTVNIGAIKTTIQTGQSTTLHWSSTNAYRCDFVPDINSSATSGSMTITPAETTTYTVTATGVGGAATASVAVAVIHPRPSAGLTASPDRIAPGESAALTWTTANADACSIEPEIGMVDLNGAVSVSPDTTTIYTLTATGPGGAETAKATVTVLRPPTVTFTACPSNISSGEESSLTWSTTDADTCTIEPDIGTAPVNGVLNVRPSETTTYVITASGPGGVAVAETTVVVTSVPVASISANPVSIEYLEESELSWNALAADTCSIEPGIGPVATSGSMMVQPEQSETYSITARGPGGTASAMARVLVIDPLDGDPTHAEQAHLEAINRARKNPGQEAQRLGIDLFEGVTDSTFTGKAAAPLVMNAQLLRAAREHSLDMARNRYFSHYSPDGRTPADRMTAAGYGFSYASENIGYVSKTDWIDEGDASLRIHDDLFIDAGVDGRGHRLNILSENAREIGIGLAVGPYNGLPFSYKLTCDFGAAGPNADFFLLGVVYEDRNGNRIYDAGEGVRDVELSIHELNIKAYSATAGGYGIPVPSGAYTVMAVLPDGWGRASRRFSMSDRNVKIDFMLDDFTYPEPEVGISASPQFIRTGDGSALSWTSNYADAIEIHPGIGPVSATGVLDIQVSEKTTYTITAAGPGGVSTASVTVYTDDFTEPPTANILTSHENIMQGESVQISWSAANASFVFIDNGIGEVEASGTVAVSPYRTTTYTITASGSQGIAQGGVTVNVRSPISMMITSHSEGERIHGNHVTIEGLIANSTGNATGVSVNGVTAVIYGNRFVANGVPIMDGENTITVFAVDPQGFTQESTMMLRGEPPMRQVRIVALKESGLAPFETTLRVDASFILNGPPVLNHAGPGEVEYPENFEENEFTIRLETEGVHYFTAEATDPENNVYSDTIAIVVLDRAEMDVLLKGHFDGMKNALFANDVEGALGYFHEGSRPLHQEIFTVLSARLPELASQMREIELVYIRDRIAKYRIKREAVIQGNPMDVTYYIYFVKDLYGLWKIESM